MTQHRPDAEMPGVIITERDGKVVKTEVRDPIVCDFCNLNTVAWRYPARTFDVAEYGVSSLLDWAACERCSGMIERGDRDALVANSLAAVGIRKGGVPRATFLEAVKFVNVLQAGFFANRTGERVPA